MCSNNLISIIYKTFLTLRQTPKRLVVKLKFFGKFSKVFFKANDLKNEFNNFFLKWKLCIGLE